MRQRFLQGRGQGEEGVVGGMWVETGLLGQKGIEPNDWSSSGGGDHQEDDDEEEDAEAGADGGGHFWEAKMEQLVLEKI